MSKSRKFKKSITMILTLLLLISSVATYGASPKFSDIKGHWASKYIEEMAAKEYVNGYLDGTFKPDGDLTLMEVISALSRFSQATETEKTNAINGYTFLFNELKITQNWEKEGLAIALFKNILTEKDVRDAKKGDMLNKPVNREKTSVYLAKAMKLDELEEIKIFKTLPHNVLGFKDRDSITLDSVKYIKILLDKGILDPKGKGKNDFQPKAKLTRGEMSKLLSEGDNYLKRNPGKTETVEYEYITDTVKRITEDAGTMLVIDNKLGEEKGYRIDNKTTITIDGKKSDVKSLAVGQEVKLKIEKDTINIVSIEVFAIEETISGLVKSLSATNKKITLEYKDDKKILTKDYNVDSNASIYLNDKSASLKDLEDGDLLELKVKGDTIIQIEATSKVKKVSGIIKEIKPIKEAKETIYIITIEDKDSQSHKYLANSKTTFYRKNKTVDGKEIKLKDEAYIYGEYDLDEDIFIAKTVDADVFKSKARGQVIETVNRVNRNTLLTIENRDTKKEESYDLASDVEIIIDGKTVKSLPADPGYYAELQLENEEIVEIYIDTKRAEESITGRIVDINYRERIIYLEDNSIIYDSPEDYEEIVIDITDKTLITFENLSKGRFDDLRIGDVVIVGGVYKGRNFEANLIIIR